MSEDKLKKLIEAGITAEDIERELAKRAQAPKKKIIKKIEPHNVSIEVKSIKPESIKPEPIPDIKEDEFVQLLRNKEASKKAEDEDEYGDRDYTLTAQEEFEQKSPEEKRRFYKYKEKLDKILDNPELTQDEAIEKAREYDDKRIAKKKKD